MVFLMTIFSAHSFFPVEFELLFGMCFTCVCHLFRGVCLLEAGLRSLDTPFRREKHRSVTIYTYAESYQCPPTDSLLLSVGGLGSSDPQQFKLQGTNPRDFIRIKLVIGTP